MKTNQQIRLGRDFHLLNITQFLGAFNDNVFKLFLIYALIAMKGEEAITSINHLAGAIFVLPFLRFSFFMIGTSQFLHRQSDFMCLGI